MEGELFDPPNQQKFQTLLIQDKNYRPNNLTDDEIQIFGAEGVLPFKMAQDIFKRQNYVDPPMRGRTSFALLKKMCLCTGSTDEPIMLTDLGRNMLHSSSDMGETFLNYFLKWELPNPVEHTSFKKCSIRPFIGTLHLIQAVNQKWAKLKKRPVGLSREEFALFVPTLLRHTDIDEQASKVIQYRKCNAAQKKSYAAKIAAEFLGISSTTASGNKTKRLLNNLKDYADNTIRYFRLTRYIQIRGNGHYVDLEPRRRIEIDELLAAFDGSPVGFENEIEYVDYMINPTLPDLPWNRQEVLKNVNEKLSGDEIPQASERLREMGKDVPPPPDTSSLGLAATNESLRGYLVQLQKHAEYHEMAEVQKIERCINDLNNIHKSGKKHSVELERQVALAFMALNDATRVVPNYPVGDDGEPTFTAPAGVADLECYYEGFNMVCEATMLTTRDQWINEGQPVMRHLRDFEVQNSGKTNYCLFVAPKVHVDTAETYWVAVVHGYKKRKQRIVPMTITTLIKLLEILILYKQKKRNVIPHADMMRLYDKLLALVSTSDDSLDWVRNRIPEAIDQWGAQLVQ